MSRVAPGGRVALGVAIAVLALGLGIGSMFAWESLRDGSTQAAPSTSASPNASLSPIPSPEPSPEPTVTPSWVPPVEMPAATGPASSFSKHSYVLHLPVSPWVVVNKIRPLQPQDYVPPELVVLAPIPGGGDQRLTPEAAAAFTALYSAADAAGAGFRVSTAYRSYNQQKGIYNSYVAEWGRSKAETFAARAGYSEHQTGTAVDIYTTQTCKLKDCFADTAAAQWVAAHAHEYGFIVRYPPDKQQITGYRHEPWHLRYVGVALATEMFAVGPYTMEEFFGLQAAPDYVD